MKKEKSEGITPTNPSAVALSSEFKVASQIFACNETEEKVWFSKLAKQLKPYMNSTDVMKSLRTLFDWGIVKAEYGPTDKNQAGRLLYIAGESRSTIKEVYEKYWRVK
jgi:predicted transcriptional regulator